MIRKRQPYIHPEYLVKYIARKQNSFFLVACGNELNGRTWAREEEVAKKSEAIAGGKGLISEIYVQEETSIRV